MDEFIKNMYDWDEKRKEKINVKRKNQEKNIKITLKEKPKIDKNSYMITVNRNPEKIFNRLYLDDVVNRKKNKELLEQIYTPTFKPNLMNNKNRQKHGKRNLNTYRTNQMNTMSCNTIHSNRKNEDILSDNYSDRNDEGEFNADDDDYDNIRDDVEVCDIIRAHVFKKFKNKKRYNTCENLNTKKKESIKNQILNKNDTKDSNLNKNLSPKPLKKNKIRIKKEYEYLITENKNRNRSGFL